MEPEGHRDRDPLVSYDPCEVIDVSAQPASSWLLAWCLLCDGVLLSGLEGSLSFEDGGPWAGLPDEMVLAGLLTPFVPGVLVP